MPNISNTISNDPVRMRALAGEVSGASKHWKDRMDELSKGLNRLMRHCSDAKIDEFKKDFVKAQRAIDDMAAFLTETNKHLLTKADEFERTQNI